MARPEYHPFTGMSVTGAGSTATSTITLNAALTGHRTFDGAGVSDGAEVIYTISYPSGDANEGVNVLCKGTYTATGTTLTRTNLEGDTTHVHTATAEVRVVGPDAERLRSLVHKSTPYIEPKAGISWLERVSGTSYTMKAGRAIVDGALLDWSDTTRSGLTALTATKGHYVYLYDNSGTPAFEEVEKGSSSGANDPVWDSDLGYYKKGTSGTDRRWVAYFVTDSSGNIEDCYCTLANGMLHISWETLHLYVNAGAGSSSWASITIDAGSVPGSVDYLGINLRVDGPSLDGALGANPIDLGTQQAFNGRCVVRGGEASVSDVELMEAPASTFWWRGQNISGSPTYYVQCNCAEVRI